MNITVRRAELNDQRFIINLPLPNKNDLKQIYGLVQVGNLIECSYLALTVLNESNNNEIIGFGAIDFILPQKLPHSLEDINNPTIFLNEWNFQDHLNDIKKNIPNIDNSMYLMYFSYKDGFTKEEENHLFKELCKGFYKNIDDLEYIFYSFDNIHSFQVNLPSCFLNPNHFKRITEKIENKKTLNHSMIEIQKEDDDENDNENEKNNNINQISTNSSISSSFILLMSTRFMYFPYDITIRKARVVDNDDLIPILEKQNKLLIDNYGTYFVAEMIENQNDTNNVLIATIYNNDKKKQVPIGIMGISNDINTTILTECFELDIYTNFNTNNNVFVITIFAIENEYEKISPHFLSYAFSFFSNKEYCIVTLPSTSIEPYLISKYFNYIPFKPSSTYSHVLYLMHRNTIMYLNTIPKSITNLNHKTLNEFNNKRIYVERFINTEFQMNLVNQFLKDIIIDNIEKSKILNELKNTQEYIDINLDDNPRHVIFLAMITIPNNNNNNNNTKENCKYSIIGITSIGRPEKVNKTDQDHILQLKIAYDIEKSISCSYYRSRDYANILFFILNPLFNKSYSRIFLKHIMRLYKKTCLFYILYPLSNNNNNNDNNNNLINYFTPNNMIEECIQITPRKWDSGNKNKQLEIVDSSDINNDLNSINGSLFFLSKKMLNDKKIIINDRIVIIGASDTGLTIIKNLLLTRSLQFNNITLISTTFPSKLLTDNSNNNNNIEIKLFNSISNTEYLMQELGKLAIESRIKLIKATVSGIDRNGKAVILKKDKSIVLYNYLIIATGLQNNISSLQSDKDKDKDKDKNIQNQYDNGYFMDGKEEIIHKQFRLKENIEMLLKDKDNGDLNDKKVIIYGSRLNTMCMIQYLLENNIPSNWIYHFTKENKLKPFSIFHDYLNSSHNYLKEEDTICNFLNRKYNEINIKIQYNYTLTSIESDISNKFINKLQFNNNIYIDCDMFICTDKDNVNLDIFNAINECGLVYDGRLIINHLFETVDPFILSGGSIARFSRRHKNEFMNNNIENHEFYDSRESGNYISNSLLNKIYNKDIIISINEKKVYKQLPSFILPKSSSGIILGGFCFISINIPIKLDKLKTYDYVTNPNNNTLNKLKEDIYIEDTNLIHEKDPSLCYCCLTFDENGFLIRLFYIGKEILNIYNLSSLVGLHETYLNSAIDSYNNNLVKNWIEFFKKDWIKCLYHDRFIQFCSELKILLYHDNNINDIIQKVVEMNLSQLDHSSSNNNNEPNQLCKTIIGRGANNIGYSTKRLIESHLIEFIGKNRDILDMYLLPGNHSNTPNAQGITQSSTINLRRQNTEKTRAAAKK